MFKSAHFRLGIILSLAIISLLIVLPKKQIKIDNQFLTFDQQIGGYVFELFGKTYDFSNFKFGLDLNGGVRLVLLADTTKLSKEEIDSAVESAVSVIERRVNYLGVSEPYIVSQKSGDLRKIIVELPGVSDVEEAKNLVGQTAQLRFKVLKPDKEWSNDKFQEYFFDNSVWDDSGVTGADLKGVDVVFADASQNIQNANRPQIRLKFTAEGRQKFSDIAKANVGKPVAIFLDEGGIPLSMPVIDPELSQGLTGDPVINGTFDLKQAQNLSIQLRAGALPVPVKVIEEKTIGATLGAQSVEKSFFAGVVGMSVVVVFMIYMYKKLGIFSGFALVIYTLFTLAVFKAVPVVLTLPGIAGFVLSIGMACDANILIFERIKEEIYWGKPKNLAVHLGFDRAWNSIRDSNISSLITAFILFEFGAGAVRGFALTLAIGILVSLFTSIFVVRTFVEVAKIK